MTVLPLEMKTPPVPAGRDAQRTPTTAEKAIEQSLRLFTRLTGRSIPRIFTTMPKPVKKR